MTEKITEAMAWGVKQKTGGSEERAGWILLYGDLVFLGQLVTDLFLGFKIHQRNLTQFNEQT
jgi:hypothetical protein